MGLGAALGVALGFGLGIGTAGLMAGLLAVAAAAPAAGRDAQGTAAETGRGGDVLKMLKENLYREKTSCAFCTENLFGEDVFFLFFERGRGLDDWFGIER